ncbi:MAG: hypothetical protein CMH64_01940 [Nanoarchaeota archaeon]|nr:hypothetical protein [Nanoarchaeota archaeon]|tara:strand:+ start:982 stop:1845 length:864 start_codon:yes stop_codon:yes gene_type:complete
MKEQYVHGTGKTPNGGKRGYKHNTSVFGTDAENYVSRLFMMMRNPNGSRRPDLITMDGMFDPRLSFELKSGLNGKGVLVDYQLHYAFTLDRDYWEVFGEESPKRKEESGMLAGLDWEKTRKLGEIPGIAYYYNIIERVDGIKAEGVDKPLSSIQLKWGNQCIVPHEFGFYNFVACMAHRTGGEEKDIIEYLMGRIKSDVVGESGDYSKRKDNQSWQSIHSRDIMALYTKDWLLTTPQGRKRVDKLKRLYPGIDDLKRIEIPGPNGTKIYVLANPEHEKLFDEQLRGL